MAIHYIDMDYCAAAAFSSLYLFTQTGEVGGQNGWQELDQDDSSLAADEENGRSLE
jgi:hypothetical protein